MIHVAKLTLSAIRRSRDLRRNALQGQGCAENGHRRDMTEAPEATLCGDCPDQTTARLRRHPRGASYLQKRGSRWLPTTKPIDSKLAHRIHDEGGFRVAEVA